MGRVSVSVSYATGARCRSASAGRFRWRLAREDAPFRVSAWAEVGYDETLRAVVEDVPADGPPVALVLR